MTQRVLHQQQQRDSQQKQLLQVKKQGLSHQNSTVPGSDLIQQNLRANVNDLSLHEKQPPPGAPQSNMLGSHGLMGSQFEDDQAWLMQNGPMPKKRGNMNPASKNFNKVPPKRYKAGSASNQAPAANPESQPAASSMS